LKRGKSKRMAAPKKSKAPKKALSPTEQWVLDMNKDKAFTGHAQVRMASDAANPFLLRRPTGILGLDIALGGGLHAGGAVEVQGSESVGKTHLVYRTCGENQRIHGDDSRILIWGTEIRTDKSFARLSGFCIAYSDKEIEELSIIRENRGMVPFTDEEVADLKHQVGDVAFVASDTADSGFEVLLKALRRGIFQIIVVESLGALITKLVEDGTVSDKHYGGAAGVVTTFQNKMNPLFMLDGPDGEMLETTLIGINQARANIGAGTYDRKEKGALGAFAWKHSLLASILLERGGQVRESEKGPVVGRTIRWTLAKGKAGTHDGKKGKYDFFHVPKMEPVFWGEVETTWLGGVAVYNEVAEVAKAMGLIKVAGSWISYGDLKVQGLNNFAQKLAEDEELCQKVRDDCIDKSNVLVRYK
jgi:RecA/RadA recombinase